MIFVKLAIVPMGFFRNARPNKAAPAPSNRLLAPSNRSCQVLSSPNVFSQFSLTQFDTQLKVSFIQLKNLPIRSSVFSILSRFAGSDNQSSAVKIKKSLRNLSRFSRKLAPPFTTPPTISFALPFVDSNLSSLFLSLCSCALLSACA